MPRRPTVWNIIAVLLLGASLSRSANAAPNPEPLKWNVVRVRPVYHEQTRRTFETFSNLFRSLAEELQRKNQSSSIVQVLRRLSAYYKTQANSPWHGSGWIYFPKDGVNAFVITNKHVAGQAGSVHLEFEGQRRPPIIDMSVIYTDPNYDIAIIEVDRNRLPPESTGFQLADQQPTDGSEVWSTGFPSYGDSTVFALTPGHVSSAELPGGDGAKYIVHTATANRGNSGGPLLVEAGPVDAPGFRVAGMNAWRIVDSTNVNIAIPRAILENAIKAAQTAQETRRHKDRLMADLKRTAKRLADELGSSRPDAAVLSSLVSYTFVSQRPEVMTADLLNLVKGQMSDDDIHRFEESPVEYSRETLLQLFRATFATGTSDVDTVKFERITDEDRVSDTGQIRSVYTVAGKRQEIFWIWEHGAWRVADASFEQVLQVKFKTIEAEFRKLGVAIDLSSGERASRSTREQSTPIPARERGTSFMFWSSRGRRGAVGENFQSDLERKDFSALGLELGFPLSRYFWFCTGLAYGPRGVAYAVTRGDTTFMIDEHPVYLQLPLLFRVELPLETRHATLRVSGKAGLAGALIVQRDGTFRDTVTGETRSLNDASLDWFADHAPGNVAAMYGGGIEIGLGREPSVYFGSEVVSEAHLLKEWSGDVFGGAANYRYQALRWGVFVKYQSFR
jgi:S1-C subfamily serine protease